MNQLPNHNTAPKIPDEVMEAVHEAALKEDQLRDLGANKDRITSKAHMPLSIKLAKLAAKGVDIAAVDFTRESDNARISDEDWAKIERLMDTQGLSSHDARRQVLGK